MIPSSARGVEASRCIPIPLLAGCACCSLIRMLCYQKSAVTSFVSSCRHRADCDEDPCVGENHVRSCQAGGDCLSLAMSEISGKAARMQWG